MLDKVLLPNLHKVIEPSTMKVINEIMQSTPSSCTKLDKVQFTADKMTQSKLSFLPVVDENKTVIGTVRFNDLQRLINSDQFFNEELCVADVMTAVSSFVTPYDDEATALKLMRSNHSSHLPVVDETNHLKGVVSFITLARRIVILKQQLGKDAEKLKVRGLGLAM